jgi:hypothetical protein
MLAFINEKPDVDYDSIGNHFWIRTGNISYFIVIYKVLHWYSFSGNQVTLFRGDLRYLYDTSNSGNIKLK